MPTLEQLAMHQMTLDLAHFAEKVAGPCVLLRLDERGGDDEPIPWATHHVSHQPVTKPRTEAELNAEEIRLVLDDVTLQSEGQNDGQAPLKGPETNVFIDTGDAEATLTRTYSGDALLPIPPARGAATVVVVPRNVEDEVDIGRKLQQGVSLHEMSVSRRHAGLKRNVDGVGFLLWDAGSKNGTQVNGRRLKRGEKAPLNPGDVLDFGDVRCLFLDVERLYQHLPLCMD
ncbi:MAG: FHA domain-containing protein [Deltaproteobacteria bacterium]|nr:FHA domain-containing protein [Deltaproteobacteria bacterium]